MKRGEIWWHEPPDEKPRPVLVLTRDEAIGRLIRMIVVPATGRIRGMATEVEVGRQEGMSQDGVLSLDNTSLVRHSHLTERITALGPAKMDEVCKALDRATSC